MPNPILQRLFDRDLICNHFPPDLRDVITANAIKDMQAEEYAKFIQTMEVAICQKPQP